MKPNEPEAAVTVWLEQLKSGDADAVGRIWNAYFARLVSVARGRLRAAAKAAADEEDVALSAFDSFCRGVEGGRFPRLDDRDDLWQVLFVLTARKTSNLARKEGRLKRGGGKRIQASGEDSTADLLESAASPEPSPAFAAQVAEECRLLLAKLSDGELRDLAIWKMEGFTNEEIARKIDRSVPTVERKLARIRKLWERETPE